MDGRKLSTRVVVAAVGDGSDEVLIPRENVQFYRQAKPAGFFALAGLEHRGMPKGKLVIVAS